jgi:selenocysteine-specific translation elongation factor
VGLALRGIESDELDRGFVVTTDKSVTMTRSVSGKVSLVKYWGSPLKEGMVLHLGHWMQMVPCRVTSASGDDFRSADVVLDLDSDMIFKPGDKAIIMYLEGGKLRVAGSVVLGRCRRGHPLPHSQFSNWLSYSSL